MVKFSTIAREALDEYGEFDENGDVLSWKNDAKKPISYESAVRTLIRDFERIVVFLTEDKKSVTRRHYNSLEARILKEAMRGVVVRGGVFGYIVAVRSTITPLKMNWIIDRVLEFLACMAPPLYMDEEANAQLSMLDKYSTLRTQAPQIDVIFDTCQLIAKRDCYMLLQQIDAFTKHKDFRARGTAYTHLSKRLRELVPEVKQVATRVDDLKTTNYSLFKTEGDDIEVAPYGHIDK